jgi:AhpD family alkylhydroperoxidase
MAARMSNRAWVLPGAYEAIQALQAATERGGVPASTLALSHLRASQINGCNACIDGGCSRARKAGETDERLLAVAAWREALRSDGGVARPGLTSLVRGAQAVAERAMTLRRFVETPTRIRVNGIPGGVAWAPDGSPFAVVAVTVKGGRIVVIDVLADPDRLGQLDLAVVPG